MSDEDVVVDLDRNLVGWFSNFTLTTAAEPVSLA